jgi:hypothetical protein
LAANGDLAVTEVDETKPEIQKDSRRPNPFRETAELSLRLLVPAIDAVFPTFGVLLPAKYRGDFLDTAIRKALARAGLGDFDELENEQRVRQKAQEARRHIETASTLLTEMQVSLAEQTSQLDAVLREAEEKKKLAEQYGQLVDLREEQIAALRKELEVTFRQELKKGRKFRIAAKLMGWVLTLLLGALLGAWASNHYSEIASWGGRLFGLN